MIANSLFPICACFWRFILKCWLPNFAFIMTHENVNMRVCCALSIITAREATSKQRHVQVMPLHWLRLVVQILALVYVTLDGTKQLESVRCAQQILIVSTINNFCVPIIPLHWLAKVQSHNACEVCKFGRLTVPELQKHNRDQHPKWAGTLYSKAAASGAHRTELRWCWFTSLSYGRSGRNDWMNK